MARNGIFDDTIKIKPITLEQASKYIPVDEDPLHSPAYYFTMTPTEGSLTWSDITYYTNRPRKLKIPKSDLNCQWIYVLSNETLPGLVKIGFTKNKPEDRTKQINTGTGVAMDFKVEWAYPCVNAHDLEQLIHAYLEENGFRVNKRKEFFNISVEDAKSVIERLGEPYRMEV